MHSHSQATGGDQANGLSLALLRPCADPQLSACMSLAIYLELERMGFKAWYDNRASDLTKEGMLKGIEQAAAFILFLR